MRPVPSGEYGYLDLYSRVNTMWSPVQTELAPDRSAAAAMAPMPRRLGTSPVVGIRIPMPVGFSRTTPPLIRTTVAVAL
jgi:hypothetical protein